MLRKRLYKSAMSSGQLIFSDASSQQCSSRNVEHRIVGSVDRSVGSRSCSSRAVVDARSALSLRSRAREDTVKGRSRHAQHCAGNLALGSAPGSTNALTRWARLERGCHARERRWKPAPPNFRRDPNRLHLQRVSVQHRHHYPACLHRARARTIQNCIFQPQVDRKPR